ncbi:hypothetical protein D3C83_123660 [compost metagenome]
MSISEIRETLAAVRAACTIVPLGEETHDKGLQLVERYGFSVYDAMIVASALLAGCRTIVSEDMQNGQVIEGRLTIRNPFVG